jgi:hypothetical protein
VRRKIIFRHVNVIHESIDLLKDNVYALRLFLPISALYTNVMSKCYEFQWSIQTYFNTTSEWRIKTCMKSKHQPKSGKLKGE